MNIEAPRITIAEFDAICAAEGGMVEHYGFVTEHIGYGEARVRLPIDHAHIRAGGTVSGPAMTSLGDFAVYALVMGMPQHQFFAPARAGRYRSRGNGSKARQAAGRRRGEYPLAGR
jgi:acyl-coenzyme A thioesterase PaaI-like protein